MWLSVFGSKVSIFQCDLARILCKCLFLDSLWGNMKVFCFLGVFSLVSYGS